MVVHYLDPRIQHFVAVLQVDNNIGRLRFWESIAVHAHARCRGKLNINIIFIKVRFIVSRRSLLVFLFKAQMCIRDRNITVPCFNKI